MGACEVQVSYIYLYVKLIAAVILIIRLLETKKRDNILLLGNYFI